MAATKNRITTRDRRANPTGVVPTDGSAVQTTPFRAKRQPAIRIEMVLVEKSTLMLLTSLAKTILEERRKQGPADVNDQSMQVAVNLAENALQIKTKLERAGL